jgi:hypothetical protein
MQLYKAQFSQCSSARSNSTAEPTPRSAAPEVAEADVAPHVPVKVDEDGVEASHSAKQLRDVVVRLNL